MDKPSFQNGILYHRLLIPAGGFYEWNSLKEKSTFTRPDSSVLYMAGFCDWFDNNKMPVLLHQTPTQLNRQTEYEQQSLFHRKW